MPTKENQSTSLRESGRQSREPSGPPPELAHSMPCWVHVRVPLLEPPVPHQRRLLALRQRPPPLAWRSHSTCEAVPRNAQGPGQEPREAFWRSQGWRLPHSGRWGPLTHTHVPMCWGPRWTMTMSCLAGQVPAVLQSVLASSFSHLSLYKMGNCLLFISLNDKKNFLIGP